MGGPMNDQITVEELQKASRSVERLSEFIGERRDWMLASDAGDAATLLAEAARSLDEALLKLVASGGTDEPRVRHPARLEPPGRVTPTRLVKFSEFIDQLRRWFSAHDAAALPEGSDPFVRSLRDSLAGTIAAVETLCGPALTMEVPEDPRVTADLGPVVEVDMSARLELDNSASMPILQISRGVTEFTPDAISMIDRFFAKQGIELEGSERRRFHEKALKWIKGTPEGQMLVVRLSGLSGKVEAYSSYKPRGT
jgi:hypothetical protein